MYELKDRDFIFAFTGPDGVGRKTVAHSIGSTLEIKRVISYTTRKPRPSELNEQDYHFVTLEQFKEAEANGEFLESVEINGNWYGINKGDIEEAFKQNGSFYLVVNPHGAEILKQMYGEHVVRLFIFADRDTVVQRQRRQGLSEQEVADHLTHYDADMAYKEQCEHAFPNYELAHTVFRGTNILETYLNRDLIEED